MPTPLRTPQTSGHSSFRVSNLPLWSLKSPSSQWLKLSFFICPRVSARFLHCFCTVSRDAMGTLTCKIRQRVQKLPGGKSRCFAQKWRKLETSKIRVFCPVGSFNQRARDSSSLERTKRTINRWDKRFVVFFVLYGLLGLVPMIFSKILEVRGTKMKKIQKNAARFDNLKQDFLDDKKYSGTAEATLNGYRYDITRFLKFLSDEQLAVNRCK